MGNALLPMSRDIPAFSLPDELRGRRFASHSLSRSLTDARIIAFENCFQWPHRSRVASHTPRVGLLRLRGGRGRGAAVDTHRVARATTMACVCASVPVATHTCWHPDMRNRRASALIPRDPREWVHIQPFRAPKEPRSSAQIHPVRRAKFRYSTQAVR